MLCLFIAVGGPLVFPDISDSFWETEEYFNKIQLAKIQHEICKYLNKLFFSELASYKPTRLNE